jgi:hypothetical protein
MFLSAGALVTLVGCVASGVPKSPTGGLTASSYGPLLPVAPHSCSPNSMGGGVDEIARQITGLIAKPFAGISKVDPTVEREDLADKFLIAGDPAVPPIAILERSDNGIVFWHDVDLVPMSEVTEAATTFCERRDKRAVWAGSAERCGTPTTVGIAINGQRPVVISSQVISSFRCVLRQQR